MREGECMNNYIDKNFYHLVDLIRNQSIEEVYQVIKDNFNHVSEEIKDALELYFDQFPYWGRLNRESNNYEELYNRAQSLKEHLDDYIFLYEHLRDYRSKKILYAIMNNWYQFDFETLDTCCEKNYPHYFDLDLIHCDQDEVFVDLGAYTGDTILDYLYCYGANNYHKIYGYEITEEIFTILKNNLNHFQNIVLERKAATDKNGKVYIKKSSVDSSANMINLEGEEEVSAVSLDEDILEKVTMIKMDIEGAEQKALLGCQSHIQKEHPKLMISVYHNHEDLWKIPRMIETILPGYRFYLRYYGNKIFPTEVVLLAIYNEKSSNE